MKHSDTILLIINPVSKLLVCYWSEVNVAGDYFVDVVPYPASEPAKYMTVACTSLLKM